MYKIMAVDDEQEILKIIKRYLEKKQTYSVTTYTNPLQLLEEIDNYDFDLLLVDLMMPQMNGIELLEKILEKNNKQNILIMSAYSAQSVLKRCSFITMDNIIVKPFESLEYLEYKVESTINKSDNF
jgi:CheY-like chemotaxis protein